MSRSKKKNPFFAVGKGSGDSDKFDKTLAHRLFRHRSNILLQQLDFDLLPVKLDEVRTEWDFNSDGPKHYWKGATSADLRK